MHVCEVRNFTKQDMQTVTQVPKHTFCMIMICFGMSELDIKNLKRSLTRIGHGGGDAKPLDISASYAEIN